MLRYAIVILLLVTIIGQNKAFSQEKVQAIEIDSTLNVDSLFLALRSFQDKTDLTKNKKESLNYLDSAIHICQLVVLLGESEDLALQYQVEALENYSKLLHDLKAPKESLKSNYKRTISILEQWISLDHTIEKVVKLAAAYESLAALEEGNEEGLQYMEIATQQLKNAVSQIPGNKGLADRLTRYYELTTWKSLRLNKIKEAKTLAMEAIAHNPGHMRMHALLAISYFLLKKPGKTQKLIFEKRELTDDSGQSFNKVMLRDFIFLEQKGLIPDQMKIEGEKIKTQLLDNQPR